MGAWRIAPHFNDVTDRSSRRTYSGGNPIEANKDCSRRCRRISNYNCERLVHGRLGQPDFRSAISAGICTSGISVVFLICFVQQRGVYYAFDQKGNEMRDTLLLIASGVISIGSFIIALVAARREHRHAKQERA